MDDKNNNQGYKPEEAIIKKDADKSYEELLAESTNDWTVEDTMAACPTLTREEAERAHKMGW